MAGVLRVKVAPPAGLRSAVDCVGGSAKGTASVKGNK